MKIAEAFKTHLNELREKIVPGIRPMYNIHFVNSDEEDETQFTCECEENVKWNWKSSLKNSAGKVALT